MEIDDQDSDTFFDDSSDGEEEEQFDDDDVDDDGGGRRTNDLVPTSQIVDILREYINFITSRNMPFDDDAFITWARVCVTQISPMTRLFDEDDERGDDSGGSPIGTTGVEQSEERQPTSDGDFRSLLHYLLKLKKKTIFDLNITNKDNHNSLIGTPLRIGHLLNSREIHGLCTANMKRSYLHSYLPRVNVGVLTDADSQCFVGIFSPSGKEFLSASQDGHLRLYNRCDNVRAKLNDNKNNNSNINSSSNNTDINSENNSPMSSKASLFNLFKDIEARDVGWSILDADYSPSENHVIYSSWSKYVHLVNTHGDYDLHEALDITDNSDEYSRRFCVFSLRFSSDGTEIVTGTNDNNLYIYNLERKVRMATLSYHTEDVNSVEFGDCRGNVVLSGSDDRMIYVWDTRSHGRSMAHEPVGMFQGHFEGITHLSARCSASAGGGGADGRYFISNSKDQSIKLWDLRKMNPLSMIEDRFNANSSGNWDYRTEFLSTQRLRRRFRHGARHSNDNSLMTYRGHVVLQTLIRAHISPEFSTGCRYIIAGSRNGAVFIWDIVTGELLCQLAGHYGCVRDCSWHPYDKSLLCSSSWDSHVGIWTYPL